MLKGIVMLLFLYTFCCGYAQNQASTSELDSVVFYISKSQELHFSKNTRLRFAEKAYKIAQQKGLQKPIINTELNLVGFLFSQNDSLNRVHTLFSTIKKRINNSTDGLIASYWYKRGEFHHFKHVGDSAYFYYNKGLKNSLSHKNSAQIKIGYYKIARLLYDYKEYVEAKKNVLLGIDIHKLVDDFSITNKLYLLKSNIESKMGNHKEAFRDLIFVKNQAEYFGDQNSMAHVYNKIGTSLLRNKVYDSAFYYFEKGIAVKNDQKYMDAEYLSLLNNKSYTDYYQYNNERFFEKSAQHIIICKVRGFDNLLFTIHRKLAKVYKEKYEYAKSIKHVDLAIENFTSHNVEDLYEMLFLGAELNKKKAVKYTQKYLQFTDSINFSNRRVRTKISKIKFEVKRKEQLNLALKKENAEKHTVLEKEQFNNIIAGLGLVAAMLTLITISYIVIQRRKKQVYLGKLERVDARENERQRLAKKLHDEIAGDLNILHLKLQNNANHKLANSVNSIKDIVRDLSHELSSESFEEVGFKDQVINLIAENFTASLRVKINGLDSDLWGDIAPSIKRVLYLTILDIVKNSTASTLEISFLFSNENIVMEVVESGTKPDFDEHSYFVNLTQRILEINGNVVLSEENSEQYNIIIPIMSI